MNWACYFGKLKDWKQLPAYRLEPRIDSFIGYYLKEIVSCEDNKILGVIPEFPIRKKTLDESEKYEKSIYADFLLFSEEGPNYLVEVKTDSKSIDLKQVNYYKQAKEKRLDELIKGIGFLYRKTDKKGKVKYDHLIEKLKKIVKITNNDKKNFELELIGKNNKEIKIIYVQPSENKKNKVDADIFIYFDEISEWIEKRIKDKDNCEFEKELCRALRKWKED